MPANRYALVLAYQMISKKATAITSMTPIHPASTSKLMPLISRLVTR